MIPITNLDQDISVDAIYDSMKWIVGLGLGFQPRAV
jgi:hypothetical protein